MTFQEAIYTSGLEGEKRGFEKGLIQGRREGMQEAIQEAIQEGMQEGIIKELARLEKKLRETGMSEQEIKDILAD